MTVGLFRDVYHYDASHVKSKDFLLNSTLKKDEEFKVAEDSGWHCSWCFKAEGILKKMQDAPRSDYPRWGDFPGIANITFIQGAIRDGLFFDRSPIRGKWKKRQKEVSRDLDPHFAPQFVIDNKDKFGYLLENPYKKTKHTSTTTRAKCGNSPAP